LRQALNNAAVELLMLFPSPVGFGDPLAVENLSQIGEL